MEGQKLTLAQLIQGDTPQMPERGQKGSIKWYEVQSTEAATVKYQDFEINRGSMSIGSGNAVFRADSNGIYLGNATYASAPFRVDMSGNMYAENVVLDGEINATSGSIGGFTVTADKLYGGTIQTALEVGTGATGVVLDTAGLRGYDSLLGMVFNLPTDGSSPMFSSGTINNTVYNLQNISVIRTSDTVGDGTANSAGVLINSTGIYATAANQTLSNANVKISSTGEATFSGNVKGGQTAFMTGTGYFIGLDGNTYKLSIGDPAGNYMNWDGAYLRIKGALDLTAPLRNVVYATVDLPVPPSSAGYNFGGGYE